MIGSGEAGRQAVVFIMGPGHCGSTLLDLILGSHSQCFSLGELRSSAGRKRGEVGETGLCAVCNDRCPFWDRPELADFLRRYFRWSAVRGLGGLDSRWGALRMDLYRRLFAASGARVLVDSGKTPGWIRRQRLPAWQWRDRRAFLVYMHRDGRAVVNSFLRKYPERGIAPITREWLEGTRTMERYFSAFPESNRIRVAYEELAVEPESTVRRLCGALGLDFQPEMLAYWRHDHHPVHGNAGTRSLIHRFRAEEDARREDGDFYDTMGLGIRLDLRWKTELDRRDHAVFDEIAGEHNRAYAYEPPTVATEPAS